MGCLGRHGTQASGTRFQSVQGCGGCGGGREGRKGAPGGQAAARPGPTPSPCLPDRERVVQALSHLGETPAAYLAADIIRSGHPGGGPDKRTESQAEFGHSSTGTARGRL